MKLLKTFWYVYRRSVIDVDYYKDLLKVKIEFSLKYFVMLTATAALLTTLRFAVPTVPKVQYVINDVLSQFSAIYPDDLVVTTKEGRWEINKQEPYIIPLPPILQAKDMEMPANLIVFDHRGTINDLGDRDTFVIINSANLITINSQNKIEVYPLDSLPDGEFTKVDVDELITSLRGYARFVPAIIIFFGLVGTMFYFMVYRLMYLLLAALLLLAMGYLKGVREKFSTYYKLALHALTLPLTIELMLIILGVEASLPFWFLGTNVLFGIVVIHHLVNTKSFK